VKQDNKSERPRNEYAINQQLVRFNVPHILRALSFFVGPQTQTDSTKNGWLVVLWIKSFTLSELTKQPSLLTLGDWLNGLQSMIELFACTDPENLATRIKLFHKDLHADQILFDIVHKNWFLIDFGLSEIEYSEPGNDLIPSMRINIVSSSSVPSSNVEFKALFSLFLTRSVKQALGPENATYFKKLKDITRGHAFEIIQTLIQAVPNKEKFVAAITLDHTFESQTPTSI